MKVWLLVMSAALARPQLRGATESFPGSSASPTDQNSSSSTAQSSPAAAAPAVEPADPDKVKHNVGKADVDAIGDRNVNCKTGVGQLVWRRETGRLGQALCPAGGSDRKADPGSGDHRVC